MINVKHFAGDAVGSMSRSGAIQAHPVGDDRSQLARIESETEIGGHGSEDVTAVEGGADAAAPEAFLGQTDDARPTPPALDQPGPAAVVGYQQTEVGQLDVENIPLAADARIDDNDVQCFRREVRQRRGEEERRLTQILRGMSWLRSRMRTSGLRAKMTPLAAAT